ncbi:MAG: hypothetical protein QM681_23205 [Novosphingobium sp.]
MEVCSVRDAGIPTPPAFVFAAPVHAGTTAGRRFQLFQIGFGGIRQTAGRRPDGHSLWPGFTNVPNEFLDATSR